MKSTFKYFSVLFARIFARALLILVAVPIINKTLAQIPETKLNKKNLAPIDNIAMFDVNNIGCRLQNNGFVVSFLKTGEAGLEYPRGSGKTLDFNSGLWLVGKLGGQIRTAAAMYNSEFKPGVILPGGIADDPGADRYRIYKINRDGTGDWSKWPFEQGAPALKAVDGSDSLDALGNKIPQLIGDQTLWWVMNDLNPAAHGLLFKTEPMAVEIQVTVFGYLTPPSARDLMLLKWKIINKSSQVYDSCYVVLWDDFDLGTSINDLVGCDTTLALGFGYNDGPDDVYGAAVPALGFLLLQGPLVPAAGANGRAFGRSLIGYRNLGMNTFIGSG